MSTTRKPSTRTVSRSLRRHWGRREQDKSSWPHYSIWRASSSDSFWHKPRWSVLWDPAAYVSFRVLEEMRVAQDKSWLLHHSNGPTHNVMWIQQLLVERHIAVLEQPPNSPNLTPCDFFFFSASLRGSSRETVLPAWKPSRRT